ncbi:MAG: polyphosphate kinase 2 family protein, partial [Methylibium sp.]|nr:polyphosphate kinase 2 family protein [Methylibium sp.]
MTRHPNADPFEPFRVGRKLRLKNFDPAEKPFSIGKREDDDARLTELALEIDRLQDLLHANGTAGAHCKLLVILQGLDTSGKDGTARAVFTHCSPLGVRVSGFRA